ncbi:cell division protein FtsQ/DivIB [Deinococcus peraridilitoris]|uniref:Cell division septal protein n=1 Tax=Deinococcus peraridilitoris (strain DSM 19664 / LMG 22246 / CIP 109416 / KR-200) TaxID=937777 RepID=K9ZVZ1_DEIPD|nr:FtsQ-type POTRA domain-containing protein [Deinococcus peraridilitoris]AFZ65803.1 cell division septal protein [Deinococcus peraridilitoris DSM 19664]
MALKALGQSWHLHRNAWVSAIAVALLAALIAALWYGLPIRSIQVVGNKALSPARVAELAGVHKGFGWAFYGGWRAAALEQSPWIRRAKLIRIFPGTVRIEIEERTPSARIKQGAKEIVIDWDGVELPGARPRGPLISGWGPARTSDAIAAARLLARYNVKSVDYTPSGLTIKTASGTAWSGSLVSLQKYAAGVTMNPSKRVNIYPWGVSVQE